MLENLELPFGPSPGDTEDAWRDWLIALLRQRRWMIAREILLEAGFEDNEGNRRRVRAWAHAAGPDIVKGQKGFNHITNCRDQQEEIDHCANQSISQGKEMIRYGLALKRRLHAIIG